MHLKQEVHILIQVMMRDSYIMRQHCKDDIENIAGVATEDIKYSLVIGYFILQGGD